MVEVPGDRPTKFALCSNAERIFEMIAYRVLLEVFRDMHIVAFIQKNTSRHAASIGSRGETIPLDQPARAGVIPRESASLNESHGSPIRALFASNAMPLPASSRVSFCRVILALGISILLFDSPANEAGAQTVYAPAPGGSTVQGGVTAGPPVGIPQTNLTPIAPPPTSYTPPPNTYGSFDPYASSAGATTLGTPTGGYPTAPSSNGSLFGLFSSPTTPPMAPIGYGSPTMPPVDNPAIYSSPPFMGQPTADVYGTPPAYPSSIYPNSTPSSLFPEGLGPMYSGSVFQNPSEIYSAFRLLQGPRFRYTYVSPGSEPNQLGINDFDTSIAFAFPNFLYMTQPIFVVPSFSLHLWDGPNGINGADLPPNAYSAFIDLGWESDPNKMVGTEFGLRLGIFTDFDTNNSKSWRARGRALINFRCTPTSSFKAGVYYVNRNEIKIVPAVGFFCRPNPFTRIDLFFPQPRYARYCRTVGTYDLWWYLTGDYGGGNWTVQRSEGYDDLVDINDLRAIWGIEWGPSQLLQAGRRTAFAEIGYVFNREVHYRYSPQDDFDSDDAIMFRIGIGY